jgi:hypothetical protein
MACSGDAKGREGAGGAFVLRVRGTACYAERRGCPGTCTGPRQQTRRRRLSIDYRKHYYCKHEEVERVTGRQPVDPSNISTYLISTRPADSRQTHRRSANRSTHSLT